MRLIGKTQTTDFDVNSLVSFRINNNFGFFSNSISSPGKQFEYFRTDKKIKPDIILNLKKFKPSKKGCFVVDEKYYIKRDYIYYKFSYKLAKFETEIKGFEKGPIVINTNCNIFGYIFFESIFQFFISYVLCQRGYVLMHSSAVEKDGKAYLFSARSGLGKTSLSIFLVNKGYNLLGDNFTILGNKKILCFPTPLMVFNHNLKSPLNEILNTEHKMSIYLRYILWKLTFGYAKFYKQIPIKEVMGDKIKKEAKLHCLFLLMDSSRFSEMKIKNITKRLLSINKFEFLSFIEQLISYSYFFPKSKIANHFELMERNIKKNIKGIMYYEIDIPSKHIENFLTSLYNFIKGSE